MLKNKYLWLSFNLTLAITNVIAINSNTSNLTINKKLKQDSKTKIEKTITNNRYGVLSNSSTICLQDKDQIYHLFDIKEIINNPKLKPYAKYIYINNINYQLTYQSEKISEDIVNEFSKNIAIALYNEERLISTDDLQIFQNQNLSKISTTAYKSDKAVIKKFTFIQFGGANKHISLTGVANVVDNIINYDDLSESLGIYNIAKSHPKNSSAICIDFVNQFFNKSSLRDDKINGEQFYKNILNSIINSLNLRFFIENSPIKNDSKDMSIRYLLDRAGNVVSAGYLQYNSKNLNVVNNLILKHIFPKDGAIFTKYNSEIILLLKWSDYADSWNNFIFLYPTIFASRKDSITYNVMSNATTIKSDKLNFNTKKNQEKENKLPIWKTVNQPPTGHKSQGLAIYIFMWHDDNNIYQQLQSISISRAFNVAPFFLINISKWTISNIINE